MTDPLPDDRSRFAEDLARSLSELPRQIPSRYLYDDLGSTLFDAICKLPWYPITRVEQELLRSHGSEILEQLAPLSTIIELGPGNGTKLATLIGAASNSVTAHLVDISPSALDAASRTLEGFADVSVVRHQQTYEDGLREAISVRRAPGGTLVLFLGSNIGNFEPNDAHDLMATIRTSLGHGDALLLGTDLIKPERDLLAAYDDPLGVTAAFNRNLLVRVNRELGGDFNLDRFTHRAVWNADASRIEMHLVSECAQRVCIAASRVEVGFEAGDTIWTESSYKYRIEDVTELLGRAGLRAVDQWVGERFALTLAEPS